MKVGDGETDVVSNRSGQGRSSAARVLTLVAALAVVRPSLASPVEPPAKVSGVRYEVTFDESVAASRLIGVKMSFDVDGAGDVALSLPSWTPGSYELDDFAKHVRAFSALMDREPIRWDKADYDTWRVHPPRAGRVTVVFQYHADQLDTGAAWATPDFAFFNGTNVFLYPEDLDRGFTSEVAIRTAEDWMVATGLSAGSVPGEYVAASYDELIDMPTFVGRFDVDSTRIDGRWYRLATYPEGAMVGEARANMWDQIERMLPPMVDVFDDVPWEHYTVLLVFDPSFAGGSALEHSNSHIGIYANQFIGSAVLASITAHEIFHAWNVKRLRPADLWPYDYGRPQPTELLWVSEGITDYYADLALVRGGIAPPAFLYAMTQSKIDEVAGTVPVALEDASLSTWIRPTDGTASIYYSKGSLAGLMLDILVRDASNNERSLDDVMKALYETTYLRGTGFTEEQFWDAVQDASGGRDFSDFHDSYVDGRDPYPMEELLRLAGLVVAADTTRVARIGITTTADDRGLVVAAVVPGGAGAAAGLRVGDVLRRVGEIDAADASFGAQFRDRFGSQPEGTPYELVVERDGETVVLGAELRYEDVTTTEIRQDPDASERASRIRRGLLTGLPGG